MIIITRDSISYCGNAVLMSCGAPVQVQKLSGCLCQKDFELSKHIVTFVSRVFVSRVMKGCGIQYEWK